MSKQKLLNKPTNLHDNFSFDDLMDEISDDLDNKIARFQARQWHKLRRKEA